MKSKARQYFDHKLSAEINMTNLVDVTLVLLIIFILVAPVLEQGISVELPKTSKQNMKLPESMTVSIGQKNKLFLGETEVSLKELQSRLEQVAQSAPETPIIVRADKEIRYQRLAEVLDRIRSSGLTKLGMATQVK